MAKKGSDFVVVACRLPQGLIVKLPGDAEIKLNGLNARGSHSGHGFTNVKNDTWETIKTVYGHAKWLTNGAVFAMPDADSATDAATDRQDANVGFNQIDPKKLATEGVNGKIADAMPMSMG
jgi:hypothetical protein